MQIDGRSSDESVFRNLKYGKVFLALLGGLKIYSNLFYYKALEYLL